MPNSASGYSKEYWNFLRESLRGRQAEIEEKAGIKRNNIISFCLGRAKGLSAEAMMALAKAGLLPEWTEPPVQEPTQETIALPQESWNGEVKSVAQVSREKGRCAGTIRRWLKSGKLNYTKVGRRYFVCIDALYVAIVPSVMGQLRAEVETLRAENARLKQQIESQQLTFPFSGESPTFIPTIFDDSMEVAHA